MTDAVSAVRHSVEVPVDPQAAFRLYTSEINRWWKRGTYYWNDRHRAVGLRFEPFVGGRFIEVYDAQSGEGFEIGRIQVWEPGRRLVYSWREVGWAPGELTEVEVLFEAVPQGTRVIVTHSGWDRVTEGQKQGEGYAYGIRELLGWYGEVARGAAV